MISILAPYGRNEVTSAAIRLADLALALGRPVQIVACGVHENKVHPLWDGQIRSGRKDGIYKAVQRSTHVVHFQCHKSWYEKASLVAVTNGHEAKHILVPNWHGLSPRDKTLVSKFDQVVCPFRFCKKVLHAEMFDGDKSVDKAQLTWTKWDSGIPPIRREGTVSNGRIRACLCCDASTIDLCGTMVVRLIGDLLLAHQRLDLTVLSIKSWSRYDRRELKKIENRWPKHMTVKRVDSLCDLGAEFHAHDWVVLPSVRADFGLMAMQALSCGSAVIANNVEPFSELITLDNGLLVPCEVRTGATKSPIAVPSLGEWLGVCNKAFSDTKLLFHLQTKDWKLVEHQAAFNLAWTHIWA